MDGAAFILLGLVGLILVTAAKPHVDRYFDSVQDFGTEQGVSSRRRRVYLLPAVLVVAGVATLARSEFALVLAAAASLGGGLEELVLGSLHGALGARQVPTPDWLVHLAWTGVLPLTVGLALIRSL